MTREERNKDYKDNFDVYVKEHMKFPDSVLESKLDIVQLQIELAVKNKDEEVYETLSLWEKHIIEARILRSELPEDNRELYNDEIEIAIADIEHVVIKAETRREIAEEMNTQQKSPKTRIKEEDQNQLSIFS